MLTSGNYPHRATEVVQGVHLMPLRTPTLLPATHTNCYVVGQEEFIVIDPGAECETEQAALNELIDYLSARGARFQAIVLTHHHPDHISGVQALVERYAVPVWAHELTAGLLRRRVAVNATLEDGQRIVLGENPTHTLECLFTPGHAPGHLCFRHAETGYIFAGDLVASIGTIVVDPPEGNMGHYLQSLERILLYKPDVLFPAHGTVIADPAPLLEYYISHRKAREQKVIDALHTLARPATAYDIVSLAYDDKPAHVWPLALRSLQAHLDYLVEQGIVHRDEERFWLTNAI